MLVLLMFLIMLLQPFPVQAATGRIKIEPNPSSAPAGSTVKVTIKLMQGEDAHAQPSVGEKAEIKIRNAKEGQQCTTEPSPSDSNGNINGACAAISPGTMTVYAESKDRGDVSEDAGITFTNNVSASPQADPRRTPQSQTGQTSGQTLANQPGLEEDRNNGIVPQNGGLQTSDPNAQITPVAIPTPDSHGDIDLLNSLIYLTGGIIFLLAGIYFILAQVRKPKPVATKEPEKPVT